MDFHSATQLIQKSRTVGIAVYEKAGGDEIGSALALASVITQMGKTAGFLFSGTIDEKWRDIFGAPAVPAATSPRELQPRDLIIAINAKESPISEIKYDMQKSSGELFIRITPKHRPVNKEGVRIFEDGNRYDCIVSVGVHGPEHFGKEFEENPFLFYEKPIVNIDASHQNEQFGEINLCDMTRSSCAEIVYELIESLTGGERLNPTESTRILTGIIEKTEAFRNSKTTPRVLEISALLIESGGDKDKIMRALFKTKPLNLLQLWGRASVRSRFDDALKALFTFIPKDDFEKTATKTSDVRFVIDHTGSYFVSPKFHAVFFENPEKNHVRVIIKSDASLMKKIVEKEPGDIQNGLCVFKNAFSGFPEAERHVDNILRGLEE